MHPLYTIARSYPDYVQDCKEIGIKPEDKHKYREILESFFWKLSRAIIVEKYLFKVPQNLGWIQIVKHQAKITQVIKKNLSDRQRVMANFIRHSGKIFKWRWHKHRRSYSKSSAYYKSRILFSEFYVFIPCYGDGKVGDSGLQSHVIDCYNDPLKAEYNTINLQI